MWQIVPNRVKLIPTRNPNCSQGQTFKENKIATKDTIGHRLHFVHFRYSKVKIRYRIFTSDTINCFICTAHSTFLYINTLTLHIKNIGLQVNLTYFEYFDISFKVRSSGIKFEVNLVISCAKHFRNFQIKKQSCKKYFENLTLD